MVETAHSQTQTVRPPNSMTKSKFIQLMKKYKPTTPQELEHIFDVCNYVGSGCFREAFQPGCCPDVIVKMPLEGERNYGITHARQEMRKIKKLKRYKVLRPHLPNILYFDFANGVTVMDYYAETEEDERAKLDSKLITKLIHHITGITLRDICFDNAGMDSRERLVFLDVGY